MGTFFRSFEALCRLFKFAGANLCTYACSPRYEPPADQPDKWAKTHAVALTGLKFKDVL